jgi:hypothetical protein
MTVKWFNETWSVHRSKRGQFLIEHATSEWWVIYRQRNELWEKVGEFRGDVSLGIPNYEECAEWPFR